MNDIRTRLAALVLTAGALCTPTGAAEPARYAIDPDHQTVAFLVEHIGYARTLGRFLDVTGAYTFDEASGTVSDVRITIDTASVSTQHDKRDEHLRGKDFLDVKAYPQMVFTADRAVPVSDRQYRIAGELELLGKHAPLTLDATLNKLAEYPIGGGLLRGKPYVMGVSARGTFKRSAVGMSYGIANGLVGDDVELIIEFEARRKD